MFSTLTVHGIFFRKLNTVVLTKGLQQADHPHFFTMRHRLHIWSSTKERADNLIYTLLEQWTEFLQLSTQI